MSEINYFNTDPKFIPAKYFNKGRINKPVQLIVIHTAETLERNDSAENIGNYFKNIQRRASTHYGVDADTVCQYVYDSNTAFGCKNANSNGVHIEHAGRAEQTAENWQDEFSQSMLKLSAQLAAYLCNKFNIPPRRAVFYSKGDPEVIQTGFCGHNDVPLHGDHWDPGPAFPWDQYLQLVSDVLKANGVNL